MSEWVKASWSNPPESKSVLLYIICMNDDLESLWCDEIILGCYSTELCDNHKGWFQEMFEHYEPFVETKEMKVVAWTLLPEKPAISFKNSMMRNNLLDVFKEKGIST